MFELFETFKTNFFPRLFKGWLADMLNFHDSCGVNNLHGMPGILGGLLSVLMCSIVDESVYGPA